MDWWQVAVIAGSTVGSLWVMHRENIRKWKERAAENKYFHGRLCSLEEKYIQMMERFLEKKIRKKMKELTTKEIL